jgi:glycosyltransferase involved in cell wall biosynthesis
MQRRVVYITYDGLGDQLGQSQVLPYILGLAKLGHRFEIVSFEKPGAALHYRKRIAEGVRWTGLRYHKRPTLPATAFDMLQGLGVAAWESLLTGADLLHVRSYVPCTLALPLSALGGIPLLFDMRGLWPDERVDGGAWSAEGRLYAGVKATERLLLRRADAITTLTLRLQRYLREEYPFAGDIRAPIHVIPTCVDLERFSRSVAPEPQLARELAGFRVLLYLGAIGSYYLPRQLAEFYLAWRRHAAPARFLVVSRQEPGEMMPVLESAGVAHELVRRTATRDEVPALARCAEASFGLYGGRELGGLGTAATKTGEALACGLPFASSSQGDIPVQFANSPCGVVVRDTRPETLDAAARELAHKARAPDVALHARQLAERWYGLDAGIAAYDALYRAMPLRRGNSNSVADAGWPRATVG